MKTTIKLFGLVIKLEVGKQEKFPVVIDQTARENDVKAIRESETFKSIVEQAKQYRAMKAN